MPDERVIQQVYGILSLSKVEFRTDEAGKSFLVPHGSAGVFVDFRDWSDGQTLVNMHAFVLEQVDVSDETAAEDPRGAEHGQQDHLRRQGLPRRGRTGNRPRA